jgi:DNA-directed RNA polymerase subunit RPC12/RpoP
MAVRVCTACDHYFILEQDAQSDVRCPRCGDPLFSISREQLQAHLRQQSVGRRPTKEVAPPPHAVGPAVDTPHSDSGPARPAPGQWAVALADSEELLRHADTIRTRLRSQRCETVARLDEARLLRSQLSQLVHELQTTVETQPSEPESGVRP